jgi:hypothetical protein
MAGLKADITQRMAPPVSRHRFARRQMDSGHDIRTTQKLLGNLDESTTISKTLYGTEAAVVSRPRSPAITLGESWTGGARSVVLGAMKSPALCAPGARNNDMS